MSDVYIYYFTEWYVPAADHIVSLRPATLAAIKGRGAEPIMESQMVIDHTELDEEGFLIASIGGDITAQIRSVELRAASRDREALKMNDGSEGKDKYMLSLESRELRKQARKLTERRTELMAAGLSQRADFVQFDGTVPAIQ